MSDIKSAFEIAMEKIESIGTASDEERLRWKFFPEGERLAARYLKEDADLAVELGKYEKGAAKHVADGVVDILSRNIVLPKNEAAKRINKRAMDGIKTIKTDKVRVENVFSNIRRVFQHYVTQGEQQRKQAYEQLKLTLGQRFQQALQKQYGNTTGMRVDVERQPQFQEEWRRLQTQLESQYVKLLDESKKELAALP